MLHPCASVCIVREFAFNVFVHRVGHNIILTHRMRQWRHGVETWSGVESRQAVDVSEIVETCRASRDGLDQQDVPYLDASRMLVALVACESETCL